MADIHIEDISRGAFEPYGDLLIGPETDTAKVDILKELINLRRTASPRLTLMVAHPTDLPFRPLEMERHIHSSQAFLPLDGGSDYLVLVAPNLDDDQPDIAHIRAFRVPRHIGINYRPNVWHHPMATLDRPVRFAVWTFVDGTSGDEQFIRLPGAEVHVGVSSEP